MMEDATGVAPRREHALAEIFGRRKVAIGVVHCVPLPGAPDYAGDPPVVLIDHAIADATAYAQGGVHGLIVENHGDIPFAKPDDLGLETAAMMSVIADHVRREVGLPVGINVLANGAMMAMAVAKAADASFIRVNEWANAYVANEGIIEGQAGRVMRYRSWLRARSVAVFADVHVKHGAHAIVGDRSIPELTRDVEFFGADAVIVTGQRTGDTATSDEVETIRRATSLPLLIGSGVTTDNVHAIMEVADGVIIGSSLKEGGVWWRSVESTRVETFMEKFGRA